jgi:DNA-binding transcriptional LysR family regulator
MHLPDIDLNLLVALDALLVERSVTEAAQRIGRSQPAMSHALGRLRKLLSDPLLVRTPQGMVPTPRAQALAGPLRQILAQVHRTLQEPPAFDPASARHTFTLAATDYAELLLLPRLMERLAAVAPGLSLNVLPLGEGVPKAALESGQLDLVLGPFRDIPSELHQQILFHERFVCVVRTDHPTVGKELSLRKFLALSHVLISPRGTVAGVVDHALSAQSLQRHVALSIPHFLIAPFVVAQTDLIVTLAERVAQGFAAHLPLRLLKPPVELPGFAIPQVWHERLHYDPAHQWLRRVLTELGQVV